MNHTFALSVPSNHMPPFGHFTAHYYLCLPVKLWPKGLYLKYTSYYAPGQKPLKKTHLFSKWCHQLFIAPTFYTFETYTNQYFSCGKVHIVTCKSHCFYYYGTKVVTINRFLDAFQTLQKIICKAFKNPQQ